MMKMWPKIMILLITLSSMPAIAQQAEEFGDYVVHYNALNSSMITADVAKSYGIRRSDSRALLNISVLKKIQNQPATAIKAAVKATARNLTGQTREVAMREINEGDNATYYIGEFSVRNMETFDFTVMVTPNGENKPFKLVFRQQFYTE
jgi:hypothetical protein